MIKRRWQEYKGFAHTGDWHLHTSYTDSAMSVAQAAETAEELGLDFIVFSEHVRKEMTYSYEDFCKEVGGASAGTPITMLPGVEAKVMDEAGNLDVSEDVLKKCGLLTMAFHTPERLGADHVYKAVKGAVSNWPVDIWAHPANVLGGMTSDEAVEILHMASGYGVAVELNLKYSPRGFIGLIEKARLPFVVGTDSHSAEEMRNRWGAWLSWRDKAPMTGLREVGRGKTS